MISVNHTLQQYGGDPASFLLFDTDMPELLPYATITAARAAGDPDLAALGGVYEWQDRPLLFIVDGSLLAGDSQRLGRIRRLVAMRGDAPYLAVVSPGSMTIYRVGLDGDVSQAKVPIGNAEEDRRIVIPYLGNLRPELSANRRWISDIILRLLTNALDELAELDVADNDAISLVGRALFVRFLADRNILPQSVCTFSPDGAEALFDTIPAAMATSAWLDQTFNGDFLPLTAATIKSLPEKALGILGQILRRAPGGQLQLGWQEKWGMLDFAHIPVGVLSQAYERYLSHHEPEKQRKEGGYYTPRHIADLMVRASFSALGREGATHKVRVLDPAAGAGVFLLTAFRQLVGERWRHDGQRPGTEILREILYTQITGFDINESALRFAALGLYLISIELDPNPEPLQKLRFQDLRPAVLRKFGELTKGVRSGDLGSLGKVGPEHLAAYDLVIGNPPWATSTQLSDWPLLEEDITRIARERLVDEQIRAPIPNEVLDLPFVWRAMEWARPNGQIAFALHARLLFQRGETMPAARNALFGALDVTGVVNGTELRKTRVWPEITAPFCLLFARNTVPSAGAGFRFTSPHPEGPLNQNGAWRIDAANAEIVTTEDVRRRPELLKILFRGTRLDLELYDRIAEKGFSTLDQYWRALFGEHRGRAKHTGNGYQSIRASSRVRKGAELPGASASYLHRLPELPSKLETGLLIDVSALKKFKAPRIHDPRPALLFKGPLLLVRESPPVDHGRIRTSVSLDSVVFNQSYHGYSTHEHEHSDALARYLALVIGSKIALWHALITSGRFGFEREVVEKFIIDEIPVPVFEDLSPKDRNTAVSLFDSLVHHDDEIGWRKVDRWVGSLFGLTSDDVETISDTLRYRLPFAANVKASQAPVTAAQHSAFNRKIQAELQPWCQRFDRPLAVHPLQMPPLSPWRFILLSRTGHSTSANAIPADWAQAIRLADELSATELTYFDKETDSLILGRLNQARYWSPSQARLAARRIIWDHIDFLSGKEAK
ncbi:class I SAM-dependent DNA methyltransferase [Pseudoxanthomonas sp. UTMC 1351]|uniref:class I SAM-dependent DNA methyltransferase n=1 Tax=Pseudoxanthomonas sp. UTMC 1351 TaxID=2695853 RepID=UPI0034D01641